MCFCVPVMTSFPLRKLQLRGRNTLKLDNINSLMLSSKKHIHIQFNVVKMSIEHAYTLNIKGVFSCFEWGFLILDRSLSVKDS